jgi:hypothetical protein
MGRQASINDMPLLWDHYALPDAFLFSIRCLTYLGQPPRDTTYTLIHILQQQSSRSSPDTLTPHCTGPHNPEQIERGLSQAGAAAVCNWHQSKGRG